MNYFKPAQSEATQIRTAGYIRYSQMSASTDYALQQIKANKSQGIPTPYSHTQAALG